MRYRIIWRKKTMNEPEAEAVPATPLRRAKKKKVIITSSLLVLAAVV